MNDQGNDDVRELGSMSEEERIKEGRKGGQSQGKENKPQSLKELDQEEENL